VLCAFDLLELDGRDLRRLPIEQRKRTLAKLVRGPRPGMVLNEHYLGDGAIIFEQACKLGCEGIVSKTARLAVPLRSIDAMGQGQESGSAGSAARGGRGLGALMYYQVISQCT
jgi:hypothetical protein